MNKLLSSAFTRLLRKIGMQTIILFSLLSVALLSLAGSMQSLVQGLSDAALLPLALLALLTGWQLARSRLNSLAAGFISSFTGLALVLNHAADLLPRLFNLVQVSLPLARQAISNLWNMLLTRIDPAFGTFPLPAPGAQLPGLLLQEIAASLGEAITRSRVWFTALLRGDTTYDPLAISLAWGLALWAVTIWAAWFVRRHNQPLPGIIPAGVLMAICLSYTGESGLLITPLLACTFLLLAACQFARQQQRWQSAAIDFAEDIPFDLAMWAGGMITVVLMLAMLLSYLSPQKIVTAMQELGQTQNPDIEQIGEALGLEPRPAGSASGSAPDPGVLPRQHLLGAGPELSQQIVMLVQIEGLQAAVDGQTDNLPTWYWRGQVFDVYTGQGWAASDTSSTTYQAGSLAQPETPPGYSRLRQRFHLLDLPPDTLYHTGLLLTANLDFRVETRPASETEQDYFAVTPLQKPSDDVYQVDSLVGQPGLAQLEALTPESPSGITYPQWVTDRYLQLPAALPPRLIELAQEITAQARTPYERASAIESYLRQYPYTLDVPQPPSDRDVVDFFLFDLQRGYCDYYATAMVVLARTVELPARMVTGFAAGEYDPRIERFVVSAADAHSWVEIYFPSLGWVEFEPTAGRAPFERPEETSPTPEFELGEMQPAAPRAPWQVGLRWSGWALALLVGLSLLINALALLDAWRLRHLDPHKALSALYRRLYRHAQRLELSLPPGETPHEFVAALSEHITALSAHPRWQKALEPITQETRPIIESYTRSLYAPQPVARSEQEQALLIWRSLSRRLWLARLLSWRK